MAKLTFTNPDDAGITRREEDEGFSYFTPDGEKISDAEEIARLNAIALPPAYRECWYNPDPRGHIQATGIDARGRKQYRYHPDFRLHREAEKFELCRQFGERLPALRAQVQKDLAQRGFPKAKATACIVALLDLGAIRVGNESYRKSNRTHGATTLLKRHVKIEGKTLRLRYRGKGGKAREVTITDRSIAAQVRRLQDLPGQRLFQYQGQDGAWHSVSSGDVNAYIHAHAGSDYSAKHFRTWHASVIAIEYLCGARGKVTIKALSEHVSERLGNTPAITRKSYIHPALIDLVSQDHARKGVCGILHGLRRTKWLSRHERALVRLLEDAPEALELLAA